MITLQDYIIFKDILSDKLIESFNKLDNSTYSDDLINENLIEELLVEAENDTKNDSGADNILYIGIEITSCQTQYKIINDIKSDDNKDDIDTILSNLEKEYNKILSKVTFKDKNIPKEFKITNNIDDDKNALDKIENNPKMGEIIADLRSLTDKIKNTITKLKEKSSNDNNEELKDEVKTNDTTKEIADKVKKLKKSFNDKVQEVNNFINKIKNKEIKDRVLERLDTIKDVYEHFFSGIQVNMVKTYLNNKQYDKANEYTKDTLEPYTNRQIERLNEIITSIKTELEFANNNDNNDNNTSEEIQKSAENEVKVLKEGIIKTISQKVNVNVEDLGKTFITIVKSLRDNGKDKPAEAAENIAKNQNSDAMIGLNLMLLGGLATKGAQNRNKIISVYCSIIAKAIQEKKYNKLFEQKPEENKTEEQQ